MFVWLRLKAIPEAAAILPSKGKDAGVLLVPGRAFSAFSHYDPASDALTGQPPSPCVRGSYSMASDQGLEEGARRAGALFRAAA